MDTSTVLFITGIISCVIGVASFVTGIASRARNDGKLEAKLGFCLQGIDEIKKSIVRLESNQDSHNVTIARLDSEIKSLRGTHESEIKGLRHEFDVLRERVNNIEKR